MSELVETIAEGVAQGVTIAEARARQEREVNGGIAVPIFDGYGPAEEVEYTQENRPPNFFGYVHCFKDPQGYRKKLARLKGQKPRGHFFTELELIALDEESEIGTYFRAISLWKNPDGSLMESNEANLKDIHGLNFVKQECWRRIGQDENWQEAKKKALLGN